VAECKCLDEFVSHAKKELQPRLKDNSTSHKLDRGQFVFFEGDQADALYLIESGVIEANVVHGDGKVYIFHFIFPGEVFGESVVYNQDYYPFSAVARKEALVWKIPRDEVIAVLDSDPAFKSFMLDTVGQKLESSYTKARCIAGERVEKRPASSSRRSTSSTASTATASRSWTRRSPTVTSRGSSARPRRRSPA
jgi:CRP-like cAMP-binding protein